MAAVATWVGALTSTSTATAFTFTDAAIGTAAADRLVVVGTTGRDPELDSTHSVSSATIGGIAATLHNTSTAQCAVGLFSLIVAAGTTATTVVNFNSNVFGCGTGYWAVTGVSSTPYHNPTPFSSDTDGTNSMSLATNIAEQGVILAVLMVGQISAGAITASNATERAEAAISTSHLYHFSDYQGGAETGRAVGGSWSTNWRRAMATISFQAAAVKIPLFMHHYKTMAAGQ